MPPKKKPAQSSAKTAPPRPAGALPQRPSILFKKALTLDLRRGR